ncbi:hypothetical protein MLD38_006436 [Melastoma candidum]|uniref:Uncharacterized protein n=1 Tax=Melastoma candidum TaxID=119954 RepID=A0ACB9RMG8_9MYRT|nr:hypothetical protein MLD38_006436 [Melastoma candidum]
MAYGTQQRANLPQPPFGFHPHHQQFPPVQGPPFLPPHPSLQPYPYPHPMQQQPQLLPHSHLLHLQPQQQPPPAFPPHMPSPPVASPFVGPYDASAPPPAPPPSDPELLKRIDKLVEYAAKNGPEFEAMIREKQQDNPAYSFLFGGEGFGYYRYKLWMSTRFPGSHLAPFAPPMMHQPQNPMLNTAIGSSVPAPQMHQPPFPPFYEQQPHLHPPQFVARGHLDYDHPSDSFKGLSGPLPADVAVELGTVINNLTGTKDSIKGAKFWFMQRAPFAPALAEALRDRVLAMDDSERQLHIIYLANDILFDSLQRRANPHELDNEALAFKPVLGAMLGRIYHNPHNKEENQSRLQKILQFWASKEVYDQDTIYSLEGGMISGPPADAFPPHAKDSSAAPTSGLSKPPSNHNAAKWQHDRQSSIPGQPDKEQSLSSLAAQPFLPSAAAPSVPFSGSIPVSSVLPAIQQPATQIPPVEKLPPYPLFPPGLIPGMVKKMQIGSGVPYSSLSPLDIPNVIPPSNISPSEILERVSKFFKEIGEVNPSEGPMKSESSKDDDTDDYEYDREPLVRRGGACIPPPPNLQLDQETGTYADGSVDKKSGSGGSGRLGLGATANPNEISQYDDVYTSYRKQRSTTYHSSMSARAATRS